MRQVVILSLFGLLTACTSQPSLRYTPEHCNHGIGQSPAPKPPLDTDTIADAYNHAKAAGQVTWRDLQACSAKVERQNVLIEKLLKK